MHELRIWLRDHGFAVVNEEILDFGVLLVMQPPQGKKMQMVFQPDTPSETLIDMVRQMYRNRLDRLN